MFDGGCIKQPVQKLGHFAFGACEAGLIPADHKTHHTAHIKQQRILRIGILVHTKVGTHFSLLTKNMIYTPLHQKGSLVGLIQNIRGLLSNSSRQTESDLNSFGSFGNFGF